MTFRIAIPRSDLEALDPAVRDRLTDTVRRTIEQTDATLTRHDSTDRFILVGYDSPPAELVDLLEQHVPHHHLTLGATP